ncbi:unnamed protein product [Periconia digitata]|uniref:Uncharacterized protein n=1 Tax=Periconia digitata TaxID=1303443 RepID=A0A9W4UCD3_9PLEO|nr:unnamed protein product [Periconia digitata]
MSTSHSPSKATPRRVLGDVTPKALNSPSKQRHAPLPSGVAPAKGPLTQASTLLPNASLNKENLKFPVPHSPSKKRSIYEVEDAENAGNAKAMFGARDPKMGWKAALTATELEKHTTNHPVDIPVPGSPTERNTPTPEPEERQPVQPPSQNSFSNFLNYDQCASQKSERPPPSPSPSPPPLAVDQVRKDKSRAELLRTRLALGIYKVRTNQTAKRSSDIISSFEATRKPRLMMPPPHSTTGVPSITLSTTPTSSNMSANNKYNSPQFLSIKANLDPGRPIGKLAPAPVLAPTAYSSRTPQDYHPSARSTASSHLQYHVSPSQHHVPASQHMPPSSASQVRYSVPAPTQYREVERTAEEQRRIREDSYDDDLSGKGKAAKGLLQLMRGSRA